MLRILIFTHPGSPIQKQQQKREGGKKISCHTFLCSHKFHKIVNYFSFEVLKKKIWTNFQRIIELFTKKNSYSGSQIPDPGVKKAPDPGSGSATLLLRFVTVPFYNCGLYRTLYVAYRLIKLHKCIEVYRCKDVEVLYI